MIAANMAQIVELPEETILNIFRFIPTSDLQNNVRLVCKKWNRIVEDHTLYDRVTIDARMRRSVALDILKTYSKTILHVVLKDRSDVNQLLTCVARCPNLKSLKLISCYGQVRNILNLNNEVNIRLIWKVLAKCPKLSSLEIRRTAFKNGIRNFCPSNVNLEKLRIKSDNNMEVIEHRLEHMMELRDLRLQGIKLYDDRAIIRICSNNEHTLTVLKLDIWKFDEAREDELMRVIGRCTKLTKLSLQNFSASGLTDDGFAHLSNLKKLRSLVITNAKKVSARAIMRLFYESHVQHLEKINLGRCPEVHQLVLKFIADRCPNLKKLYLDQFGLSCRCIGVIDLQYIGEHCPHIEHLELNSLDHSVGETLPTILKIFPNLRSFKYFVRPLKDYFSEYDPIIRKSKQELPNFYIMCSLKYGIIGFRK